MEGSQQELVPAYPNRHRPEAKATRVAVILLLLVSALLTAVVAIAGTPVATGMQIFGYGFVILFLVMAWYIVKWSRGVLAMAAAFAVLIALNMVVVAPFWFSRDQSGYDLPLLPAPVLGLVSIVMVPIQLLLLAFSMRGFNQAWNIEVQVPAEEANSDELAERFDEGGRRVEHQDDEDEQG